MGAAEDSWLSVSELARQRGVSKAAISRRLKRYEAQGLIKTRPGTGGSKLVNVPQFDRAAGEATDAVRALNGSGASDVAAPAANAPGDPILSREQARRAQASATLMELELKQRLGELVEVAAVAAAVAQLSGAFMQAVEQMVSHADEGYATATSDGPAGFRAFVRGLAAGLRDTLKRELKAMGYGMPAGQEAAE